MERAAKLIKNQKISRELLSDEDLARAAWATAVGKVIAAHTSRVALVRAKLVVEVEDVIWQRQLNALEAQIVARLRQITGSDAIQEVEFRISIPRRGPGQANTPDGALGTTAGEDDEADRISDPVLKKIYRLSRRKAIS